MQPAHVMEKNLAEMKIIQEMISTEKTYNETLALLDRAFSADKKTQTNPTFSSLQSLIVQLKDVSDKLLLNVTTALAEETDLDKRQTLQIQRTQLFKAFFVAYRAYAPLFKNYLVLADNHKELLNDVESFIAKNSDKKFRLSDYLSEPFQRGPRYSLLVFEALKRSEGLPQRNIEELDGLYAFIKEAIHDVNSSMPVAARGYQLGDCTRYLFAAVCSKLRNTPEGSVPASTLTASETTSFGNSSTI